MSGQSNMLKYSVGEMVGILGDLPKIEEAFMKRMGEKYTGKLQKFLVDHPGVKAAAQLRDKKYTIQLTSKDGEVTANGHSNKTPDLAVDMAINNAIKAGFPKEKTNGNSNSTTSS